MPAGSSMPLGHQFYVWPMGQLASQVPEIYTQSVTVNITLAFLIVFRNNGHSSFNYLRLPNISERILSCHLSPVTAHYSSHFDNSNYTLLKFQMNRCLRVQVYLNYFVMKYNIVQIDQLKLHCKAEVKVKVIL
jgi:hypothetical protein